MSGKTSLFKFIFVFAFLGVLALVAMAPTVARAYFHNEGVYGFTSRLFGGQPDKETSRSQRTMNPTTGGYFEVTGVLEAVDGNLWTVDGFTIMVTETTEIQGTFAPGDSIKVEGTLQDDGSILANQIKSPNADDTPGVDNGSSSETPMQGNSGTAKIELTDVLNANSGETWTVGSWNVMVSTETEIQGMLDLGILVKVEGTLQQDGTILAHEIKVVSSENAQYAGMVELTGTLENQDGMIWTVGGVIVELTETTEILGTPEIGATIKVEGMLQENGSILASQVKSGENNDDGSDDHSNQLKGNAIEISGELTAMDGSTWIINGQTVLVTNTTELKGTLDIGVIVKVEGYLLADGSIEAREIKALVVDTNGSYMNGSDDHEDDDHGSSLSGNYSDDDHHDDDQNHSDDHHDDDHEDDHGSSGGGSHGGEHDGGDD